MKKLLVAALAAGALALGAPVAQATHGDWTGPGCDTSGINDTTPGGQLGGQNQWNGEANVLVAATDTAGTPTPAESIEVDCELFINGNSAGVFLHAEGTGIAANAGPFSFTAESTDVVTVCTNVTVGGHPVDPVCVDLTFTQIVPQPVVDLINLILDLVAESTIITDQILCPIIAQLPDVPGVLEFDEGGDIFLLGELFIDCWPYGDDA